MFSSQPSPVGSGARAAGVGSAFIALADDATAASWNPGGLTQLERPELSAVGRGVLQYDDIGSGSLDDGAGGVVTADGGSTDSFATGSLNYLSVAIPFSVAERSVVMSVNYQQMLSFERDLSYRLENHSPGFDSFADVEVVQTGGVDAVTGAIAGSLTPSLSIGVAVNYWIDGMGHDFAWRETVESKGGYSFGEPPVYPNDVTSQDTFKHFRGVNGTIGLRWEITSEVAIGAVWKTPFTAHVNHVSRSLTDPTAPVPEQRHRLQLPASYGAGVSWRPTDPLTLSADVTYVDWEHFRAVNSTGDEFLVTGDPASEYTVDGVFTERLGAEYLWVMDGYKLVTRGGLFFDPEPSRGAPRPFYGGSLGLGVTFPSFSVDFAYQARFGLNAKNTSVTTQLIDVPNVELDTIQNLFYLSVIQYF